MRRLYPKQALVMTEFGAEGVPAMANAPPDQKGGYAFQTNYVRATLGVADRTRFLSGALHWTLREFEIFPGWLGGAPPRKGDNTRHHKGVLTYRGRRKPAWEILRENFSRVPLYRR
jgi:beta-glucuronidase